MRRQPETPQEWRDYYEKLRQKNDDYYQQSGDQRYYNAEFKYSCIVDAFDALIEKRGMREEDMKKKMRNRDFAINSLLKESYTKAEVIDLLHKAVWW